MATDKKISQLSSGAPAQAGDEYVVARSGANYKLTLTNIAANMPATTVASGDLIVSSGNVGIGTTSFSAIYSGSSTITMNNVLSNSNGDLLGLVCTVSGAGPYIDFCSVNSASNRYRYAAISMLPTTTTAASESGALLFHTANAGGNISERMRIDSSGNVGIGGTAEAYARVNIQGTLPTSGGTSVGFLQAGTVPSGSTSAAYCFHTNLNTQAASFTCANAYHYSAYENSKGAGSSITNQYGFYAWANLTGATNNYGFYSNIDSAANRWNFYANGTAANYFAGNTGIGASPTCKLLVFTGSTADGIRIQRFAGNYYSELRQTDAQEGLAFLVGDGSTVSEKLRIKGTGQTRFQPRAGNPGGAEAGDVYYDSNDNKLKVYNGTSWVDLH